MYLRAQNPQPNTPTPLFASPLLCFTPQSSSSLRHPPPDLLLTRSALLTGEPSHRRRILTHPPPRLQQPPRLSPQPSSPSHLTTSSLSSRLRLAFWVQGWCCGGVVVGERVGCMVVIDQGDGEE
ncbi:hypothetical protein Droror1_Dr00006572 [Drosera rotundifolia]